LERSRKLADHEKNQNRALLHQPVGPVKKTKLIRSAHDMRARLVPNMDSLHLTILRWDIFHDGDEPPNAIQCQEVSNMFKTTNEYYDTFYPLLISEAWRSLATAKEESNYKPFEIKVVNRLSVDSFFEVGTTMQIADNKDNNIAEGDIVFLSKGQNPMIDRKEALCLSRVYRVTRKKDAIEVSYRISGHGTGNTGLLSAFSPNSKIRGLKITSMTTIEREYAALKSLQYYDLCEEILSAKPSPILAYSDSFFDQIKNIYGLNKGQARAIWSAKENDAFTLIQG
jgi:senataxin